MAFNAPFVHHTKTAEKLQKLASYATGAGVIAGVLAFFIALDDTRYLSLWKSLRKWPMKTRHVRIGSDKWVVEVMSKFSTSHIT